MEPVNVIVVDDHQIFIDGLVSLLSDIENIRVVATASDGAEALSVIEAHPEADVVIMDISMPGTDGITAAKEIRRRKLPVRVLTLTQNADGGSISRALKAGVAGYIIKTSSKEDFVEAICSVAAGGKYYSEELKSTLFDSIAGDEVPATTVALSKRETEILTLIASELTTNEIAERLFISPYTVETHRKNLIQKLGVKSLAGLVKYAVQHGLAD